jgi:hypothetical protein
MRRTRYLSIPPPKPHQVADILTSLDEGIREVIYGLDMIIQYLQLLVGRLPEQAAPRIEAYPPPAPPAIQAIPALPQRIVSLPYQVDIIGAVEEEVTELEPKRILLDGDLFILTADSDIKFGKRPNAMYPLWAGSYLIMPRSRNLNELYVQSMVGTARVYLLFLAIIGE